MGLDVGGGGVNTPAKTALAAAEIGDLKPAAVATKKSSSTSGTVSPRYCWDGKSLSHPFYTAYIPIHTH